MRPRILIVFGTRPEAVKLAPVVHEARRFDDWDVRVCCTGQHPQLLPPILAAVDLEPDVELSVMKPGQPLSRLVASLLGELEATLTREEPTWVVAQGDTATVFASALAAYHRQIPFAHVEAGLRTHDLAAPFPEEAYRTLAARITRLHLTPSQRAADNLRREAIDPRSIVLTGNTVVDAVRYVRAKLPPDGAPPRSAPELQPFGTDRTLVLVTGHRRESFSGGLVAVCHALAALAQAHPAVDFVYPVHLNPAVQQAVMGRLAGRDNIHLLPPVGYEAAVWLLARSRFVITDSGGIQEEAPEFGKPAIVTRASTERPEALERGNAVVVGYEIRETVESWLTDDAAYAKVVPTVNPFGDGRAAARSVAALRAQLGLPSPDIPPWTG